MDKEQLTKNLTFLERKDLSIEVYILDKPQKGENPGEISVNVFKSKLHERIPGELSEIFFPKLKKSFIDREYEVMDYDPTVTPDEDVIWSHASTEVPLFNTVECLLKDKEELNYYNKFKLKYEDIWAYWIKIYEGNKIHYIINKVTPSKVIKTGGILAIVWKDEIFNKLEDDVLTIDGSFDAFYTNQYLYFENKTNFERALFYDELKQQKAEETLKKISNKKLIENFEDLKDFLEGDYHATNILTKLNEKEYFKSKTFSDYLTIIKDYEIEFDKNDIDEKNKKFRISSKKKAKLLIKVFNDDYLKSELTQNKYAVHSKTKL